MIQLTELVRPMCERLDGCIAGIEKGFDLSPYELIEQLELADETGKDVFEKYLSMKAAIINLHIQINELCRTVQKATGDNVKLKEYSNKYRKLTQAYAETADKIVRGYNIKDIINGSDDD